MENQKRKWSRILIMSVMSMALLFGATGCADNNEDGNVIIEDNNNAPADSNTNIDIDADVNESDDTNKPAE